MHSQFDEIEAALQADADLEGSESQDLPSTEDLAQAVADAEEVAAFRRRLEAVEFTLIESPDGFEVCRWGYSRRCSNLAALRLTVLQFVGDQHAQP